MTGTGPADDCVFCHLIEHDDQGTVWVEREPDAVAFRPLPESELAPGHTLVVPREHATGLLDVSPDALRATTLLAQQVGRAMRAALGATGVVVLSATGVDAGQSVPHLHFHVVPCWPDDGVLRWPATRSAHVVDGDASAMLAEMFE
ncbi:histidine triad (HIT) family protein [Curtobacterium flaccumfaciens]|uniref:Histidine triad (HIT) family protein n=1 Tax=Curtobacterium salicis TaxID=1779862 RepID=A0ABX0T6C4_9MICO|nr:histidine triad (HIT) family protein [Curtobacterium sp. WW7]